MSTLYHTIKYKYMNTKNNQIESPNEYLKSHNQPFIINSWYIPLFSSANIVHRFLISQRNSSITEAELFT